MLAARHGAGRAMFQRLADFAKKEGIISNFLLREIYVFKGHITSLITKKNYQQKMYVTEDVKIKILIELWSLRDHRHAARPKFPKK